MKTIARTHRCLWPLLLAILSAALLPSRADAQPREPVGPFAADVRIALPRFKDDPGVSADLGVATANLPTRGLGLVAGGHWYPVGKGRVTLGLGGELLVSGATKTLDAAEDDPASVESPADRTRSSRYPARSSPTSRTGSPRCAGSIRRTTRSSS